MTRDEEIAYFRKLETLYDRASTDWQVDLNVLAARLIPQHDRTPVCTFDAFADNNDIAFLEEAHKGFGFLIALVKSLGREIKALRPKPKREITFANRAGMLLRNTDFQTWIFETDQFEKAHDLVALKTHIRFKLRIESLNDLDTNEDARKGWFQLCDEFEKWEKQRRPAKTAHRR